MRKIVHHIDDYKHIPWKGYVVQVMQKVDGRWLTLEAHPKFHPAR